MFTTNMFKITSNLKDWEDQCNVMQTVSMKVIVSAFYWHMDCITYGDVEMLIKRVIEGSTYSNTESNQWTLI